MYDETIEQSNRIFNALREHMEKCNDPNCHVTIALRKAFPRKT
jgi:hypothetical protein